LSLWLINGSGNFACISQIFEEQAHTIKQIQPVGMAITMTLASIQVAVEGLNKPLRQIRDRYTFAA